MMQKPLQILVVDDEPTSLNLMQASLEHAGFQAHTTDNAEHALVLFRSLKFDMVMLDVEMQGMNGNELCQIMRAECGEELPIVMVTGINDEDSINQAYQAGATDFMTKPICWSLIKHRVTYLLRASQNMRELRASNARTEALLNASPDLMFEFDLNGCIYDCHNQSPEVLGRQLNDFLGENVIDVFPQAAAQACLSSLKVADEKKICMGKQFSIDLAQTKVWYELSISRKNMDIGKDARFICFMRDITARKHAERRILHLAYVDSLTGLPNRLSFFERMQREVHRANLGNTKLAVLFMDLDGFKDINDTLGHEAGDQILSMIAERLRLGVRPMDMVARLHREENEVGLARLGGDEFTAILPHLNSTDDAIHLADRIRDLIRSPYKIGEHDVVLSVSIGIAIYPDSGKDVQALLKHADTAMYHAKDQGRNNCQVYTSALTEKKMWRRELEMSLRTAIEQHEFFLEYQPQMDVQSGRISSVEALVRWQHPQLGLVSPAQFIPFAEETGLIMEIGEWVLRSACEQVKRWQEQGCNVHVAVNLSPRQFKNPHLLANINDIIGREFDPHWLELEITESALMEDVGLALETLHALRLLGVRISLDDFGTGYSSMSYLKQLPLNIVKVDQSFVRDMTNDKHNLMIVRAIVSLAKNLGFAVTAEGVETFEQVQILEKLECETLQGYYYSRPVSAEKIPELVAREWSLQLNQ
jgi:diguanylate cyclase (GGDEF)-like protein/PAS domain S-box-containing protein